MPKISQKARCIEAVAFKALHEYLIADDSDEEEQILEDCIEELIVIVQRRYGVDFIHGSVKKSRSWIVSVLPNIDEDRFRQMTRVSYSQFLILLEEIQDNPIFASKLQFPVDIQLIIVLYRLGSYGEGASVAKIANFFGIGDGGTVDNVTKRVFKAIISKKNKFLAWPDEVERLAIVSETHNELPYCVGYVDGTELPLAEKPSTSADDYYSRKMRFSLKAQIICDHNKLVRSLTVGYPGSVHDARIFSLSTIGKRPSEFLSNNQWIAGDSAYKLTTTMITPFKRTSRTSPTARQILFNRKFSKYRVRVEHCFGMMKERFNSLKELKIRINGPESVEFCCNWFTVCAIIHNILRKHSDDDDDASQASDSEESNNDDDNGDNSRQFDKEGVQKRNAIMDLIT